MRKALQDHPLCPKGSANHYSVHDVYLMGIATQLIRQGLQTTYIEKLLPLIRSAWLQPGRRGLMVYGSSLKGGIRAIHFEGDIEVGAITEALARNRMRAWGWLDLKNVLDRIDRRARKIGGSRRKQVEASICYPTRRLLSQKPSSMNFCRAIDDSFRASRFEPSGIL